MQHQFDEILMCLKVLKEASDPFCSNKELLAETLLYLLEDAADPFALFRSLQGKL